jgi:hypothetical protein
VNLPNGGHVDANLRIDYTYAVRSWRLTRGGSDRAKQIQQAPDRIRVAPLCEQIPEKASSWIRAAGQMDRRGQGGPAAFCTKGVSGRESVKRTDFTPPAGIHDALCPSQIQEYVIRWSHQAPFSLHHRILLPEVGWTGCGPPNHRSGVSGRTFSGPLILANHTSVRAAPQPVPSTP